MFSIDKYFANPIQDHFIDIIIKDETFRVRRLNGLDLIHLTDTENTAQKIVLILANCLIDGTTNKAIGGGNAARFVQEHLLLATEIATRIADLSNELEFTEKKIRQESRENF